MVTVQEALQAAEEPFYSGWRYCGANRYRMFTSTTAITVFPVFPVTHKKLIYGYSFSLDSKDCYYSFPLFYYHADTAKRMAEKICRKICDT